MPDYLSRLHQQKRYLQLAIGYFTRIPVATLPNFEVEELNHAIKFFPLVGYVVGAAGALVFYVAHYFFSPALAVLFSMVAIIYLTGAFHEDGLADSADALGGGWDQAQILGIMQDSRLGTYGVIALLLAVVIKFQALTEITYTAMGAILITAHALSRLSVIWLMTGLDYVRFTGKAKPLASKVSQSAIGLAHLLGLLPLLGVIFYLWAQGYALFSIVQLVGWIMLPMIAITYWWRLKIKRWIGGYTGDTLGAMQQLAELSIYLGYLAWGAMQ